VTATLATHSELGPFLRSIPWACIVMNVLNSAERTLGHPFADRPIEDDHRCTTVVHQRTPETLRKGATVTTKRDESVSSL
jgi:hypothetical protein